MECHITRIIQYFNLQQLRGTTLQANKHRPLFCNFSDKGTEWIYNEATYLLEDYHDDNRWDQDTQLKKIMGFE